ncbi:protein sidekick-2-like [Corticium candelabrum]|uniref:protein sidekick-2-like n=1 Tax=Corticium candelabrum TaxID=121492 RepID=UPI002E26AC82|nr:protein sidekick-2-like [Corticium candelabrum]
MVAKLQWSHPNKNELIFNVDVLRPQDKWRTVAQDLTVTTLLYNLTQRGQYSFRVTVETRTLDDGWTWTSRPVTVIKNFTNAVPIVTPIKLEFKTWYSVHVTWSVDMGEAASATVRLSSRHSILKDWKLLKEYTIFISQAITYKSTLTSGHGYMYRVVANSPCGDSKAVTSRDFLAGYSVPRGPPTGLSAKNIAPGVVRLTWKPLPSGISDYKYYVAYNVTGSIIERVSSSNQELIVRLNNNTWYTFSVRVELAGFTSVASRTVSILTLPAELQLPYRISLISRGLTWLEIQWSVKGGKTPNNYTVCFQPKHGTTEQTVTLCPTVSHNVKSAKLTGLTPCTLYAINVTAVSSSHFKTSQIKEFQTEKVQPTASINLQCNNMTPTSLLLTWTQQLGSTSCPIDGYQIQYRKKGGDKRERTHNTTDTRAYNITNLKSWTTYKVSVTPWNTAGLGSKSDVVDCKTDVGVPSSAPVITQLVSTSHNITVSWKSIKKSKRNGIIRGYHLEAVSINTRSPIVRLTTKLQPTVFTHTFTHLHPFTKFNISVAAYTSRGRGPSSYSLATTEQAPPDAPQQVHISNVLARSLYVHWKPPPIQGQNSIITAYVITTASFQKNDGNVIKTTKLITPAFTRRIHVTGLTPYTRYLVYVRASSVAGMSKFSRGIDFKTKQDVPNCPAIESVTVLSSTSSLLVWQLPTEPNGLLQGYTLSVVTDNKTIQTTKHVATTTRAIINQLLPKHHYTARIAAYNIAGTSVDCTKTGFTTYVSGSQPPSNFSARAFVSNTIRATWSEPKHLSGTLIGYKLVYTDAYNLSSFLHLEKNETQTDISGLAGRTTFRLTVMAITEDSASGSRTEGLAAPYQLVTTTSGTKWETEAPRTKVLNRWEWLAGGIVLPVGITIAIVIILCKQQRRRRCRDANELTSSPHLQDHQPQHKQQPTRSGSFDIFAVDDTLDVEIRQTPEASTRKDFTRRVAEYDDCTSSEDSKQTSPITVRVQLHDIVEQETTE